jgi:hypothetical protein
LWTDCIQATDGFHGTYDEVVAHEIKFGLEAGNEVDTGTTEQEHPHMYEAPDGFRGTYEEVAAYEAEHGFDQGAENMVDEDSKRETVHIYKVNHAVLSLLLLLSRPIITQDCFCLCVFVRMKSRRV